MYITKGGKINNTWGFITFCVVPKYVYTHTPIHSHTYMYLGNHIISAHINLSPLNW